jgi:CxxC-x17-CxxC domain-containing protein
MKKSPRSKSPSVPEKTKPDLAGFMAKIQDQLSGLEKKMDDWIGRFSGKPPATGVQPGPVPPAVLSERPAEVKPARDHGRGRGHERRERILHKAVCADCHKDCEIPFKPSGERPVYCKACFSKRKAGGSAKPAHAGHGQGGVPQKAPAMPPPQDRRVIVTKKGVGKVTVSEIVRPAAQDVRYRGKRNPSEKKPKRS